jgi:hypothetical protein
MTPYRSFMRTYPRTDPAQEEPRALAPVAQAARAPAVKAQATAVFPRHAIQLISAPKRWTPGHETLLLLEYMSKR